ncbi:MAG: D-amino acid aminotransferase [Acidiferrobacterales bacterium]
MRALTQESTGDIASINSVYVAGKFVSAHEALISPFDRGFIFGDGVYEVIPVFNGRLFRLHHHLQRLENSLTAIGLVNPLTHAQWQQVLQRLIDDNGAGDQSVYLQVTRGVALRNHAFPNDAQATVFAYAQQMTYTDPMAPVSGVSVITAQEIRWQRCDIKSTSLLAAVMLREQAAREGSVEAILVRGGLVTEGAASNVFIVHNGKLMTPPKGPFILGGITRDLVLELARARGIVYDERDVKQSELTAADEIWITSSTQEIKAVTQLDGTPVGSGIPGPLYTRLYTLYQEYKEAFRQGKVE